MATGKFARNTFFNFIGQVIPTLAGIITIPILIRHLGTDRFGILIIAWVLVGYFGLFDMGMGRALTQLVSEKLGKNEISDIPAIFYTSFAAILLFSLFGAAITALFASPIVDNILKIPLSLRNETLLSLYIISFFIPFVIINAGFVGFLTAYNRFDIINTIRIPMGISNFIAPLLIIPFSSNLVPIIGSLIFFRVVAFFLHLHYCLRILPSLRNDFILQKKLLKPLLKFGAWMTITNIVGPMMMYFDRFFIGSIISVSAVAYYTTPYELITKLSTIPNSLLSVLFPTFAASYAQDINYTAKVFRRATKFLALCIFPIILIIVSFSSAGLNLWLGEEFAIKSYRILQWLAIGVFFNSLAQIPFTFLQGIGKPDITSKIHFIELLIYLPLLLSLVLSMGIDGAAIAWCIRAAIDCACLFFISQRFFLNKAPLLKIYNIWILALTATLFIYMAVSTFFYLPLFIIGTIIIYCILSWGLILSAEERLYALRKLKLVT